MTAAADSQALLSRATLASVGVHALVALCIPALAWTVSSAVPIETVSFAHATPVQIVSRLRSKPQPPAQAPHHGAAPKVHVVKRVVFPAKPAHEPAAPAAAAVQQAGAASAAAGAAPQATVTPAARVVASAGTRRVGGYLPFGAEQPDPVLDPGVRRELDALGVHVTLVVTVGDDGRTQDILFQPPVDPGLEARIRSLLADANWDPAVCGGGVSCEGRATIKL